MLDENVEAMKARRAQAMIRKTSQGEGTLIGQVETALAAEDVARAAGQPGLLNQQRPNYITEESLVRSFVTSFAELALEGEGDQIPEFTFLEQDTPKILTVAFSLAHAGVRRRAVYTVAESQTTGGWKEIQTEPVEIPFINPYFPRKRAIVETMANDKLAYVMTKELDNLVFTTLTASLKSTFAAADKVWTYKDADVVGRPTGNSKTSSKGFWPTLREVVIPYFQGASKADRVINIHVLHTDLQYIYAVAGIGTQSLGQYTEHQQKVYEGNIQDINIYGHRFRIIPENWKIASGEMFCRVGPVAKMWLPPQGSVTQNVIREDGSSVRTLHRVYEILSPATYWTNVLKSTWSKTDFSA
jgi:hypothetical protein